VAKIVERAGLPVDVARDGAEAIEKIDATAYSVIVLDLMMPNMKPFDIDVLGDLVSAAARSRENEEAEDGRRADVLRFRRDSVC
jgi:CheY-like chemotaxis protein